VVLPARELAASCIVAPTSLLDQLADQQDVWITNVIRFGYFHVDIADQALCELDTRQQQLYALPDAKDGLAALLQAIREAGLDKGRLALDELGLLPGQWERIVEALPRATVVPASELVRRIRAVKTTEEIDRLRHAATIAEHSVDAALQTARVGITEIEMARAFHTRTVQEDASPVLGCLGFGTRSAMPNVHPSDAPLRRGDVIRFDVGGRYKHYRADIARIATFGEPDPKVVKYHKALHTGVMAAFEAIRPGVKASRIFEVAMEATRKAGIPHYARSHVGHGIGVDGYDVPNLAPGNDQCIEEGMVMCVETPYYELGWCGLQVKNTVVVRKNGVELLHEGDGRLRVLA
jgi:Xaa-Pro aminopeptidase